MALNEVLLKLKNGEPVELCEIYATAGLDGKHGDEQRLAALIAWVTNAAGSDSADALLALINTSTSNTATSSASTATNTGVVVINTSNTAANTLALSNLIASIVAHSRMQVETLGIPSVSRQVAVTTAPAAQQLTTSCRRVSLVAIGCNMRFRVGSSSVAAQTTDHLIQQGERVDIHLPSTPWINVIRDAAATTNGTLNITELTA